MSLEMIKTIFKKTPDKQCHIREAIVHNKICFLHLVICVKGFYYKNKVSFHPMILNVFKNI